MRRLLAAGVIHHLGAQAIGDVAGTVVPCHLLPGRHRVAGIDDGNVIVSQQTLEGDVIVYQSPAFATTQTAAPTCSSEIEGDLISSDPTFPNYELTGVVATETCIGDATETTAVTGPWSWVFDVRALPGECLVVDLSASENPAMVECYPSIMASPCDSDT